MIRLTKSTRDVRRPSACVVTQADGTTYAVEGSLRRAARGEVDDVPKSSGALLATDTMFFVVTKGQADRMRGEKSSKSLGGRSWGVFATQEKAEEFIAARGLRMVAAVVAQ